MDAKKVGKAIKVLRSRLGYTQHDLADSLGVTDKAVSKWERGLSVPDIGIIPQLSLSLNCDIDNLLEGNISFLEKTWQGLLVLEENDNQIFAGTMIYGKPLVYFLLSYFMLAGIREIYILCPDRDRAFIEQKIGTGSQFGIAVSFIHDISVLKSNNTMVVHDNPFVFGSNLTRYFQRAMSRQNRISVLTLHKGIKDGRSSFIFDHRKQLQFNDIGDCYCTPIYFFAESCFGYMKDVFELQKLIMTGKAYSEPMGNGMIACSVISEEDVFQTAGFVRYYERTLGKRLYDLYEIAQKRELLK